MKINILGDIVLTKGNAEIVKKGQPSKLFHDVLEVLKEADLNIANFEAPVASIQHKPISKTGPALKNNESLVNVLQMSNFRALGLANNHILDYGEEALMQTIDLLQTKEIITFGAGKNASEASKAAFFNINGKIVGFLAFAEHEFSIAGESSAGASHFDLLDSFKVIENAKNACDYLIVLFHGGIEYYRYPSPMLQRKCRKMAESGANLVLCQHSHCIGAQEKHKDATIIYGQGNAVFGYKPDFEMWNRGMIVQIDFTNAEPQINYFFAEALPSGGIKRCSTEDEAKLMNEFLTRSERCADKNFLENEWINYCVRKKPVYMNNLIGINRYIGFINRKLKNALVNTIYSKRKYMIAHNIIRCESHYEVLETILKESYKQK